MIAKTQLQSIIAKYFLGEIEQIKWEIEDNHLNINFITPSNMVLGSVKCNDFQMEDAELAIYNTKKLANLISICSGDLMLDLERQKDIITKLKIADENFNLSSLNPLIQIPYKLSSTPLCTKAFFIFEQI